MSTEARRPRLWLVSKVLLLASLIPLAVAVWLLASGVVNPSVQDCGSPAVFILTGRENERAIVVGGDVTAELRARDQQKRCTTLVHERLVLAGWFGGAFVVLAGVGAVVGLVDDRLRLRSEPKFETYLRDDSALQPPRDP